MTIHDDKHTDTKRPAPHAATTSAALAGGVGAMAVCCTLTLLIAAGVLGTLSGAAIGGIAVGAGIAVAATIWLTVVWLHRRRTSHDTCCPPGAITTPPDTQR